LDGDTGEIKTAGDGGERWGVKERGGGGEKWRRGGERGEEMGKPGTLRRY